MAADIPYSGEDAAILDLLVVLYLGTAMLDDATFVARMLALCEAFKAYVMVCADRGRLCAPKKTVLTGNYFDEQGETPAEFDHPAVVPEEELTPGDSGTGTSRPRGTG